VKKIATVRVLFLCNTLESKVKKIPRCVGYMYIKTTAVAPVGCSCCCRKSPLRPSTDDAENSRPTDQSTDRRRRVRPSASEANFSLHYTCWLMLLRLPVSVLLRYYLNQVITSVRGKLVANHSGIYNY